MRLSCYWSWISSSHCQSSWKFIINNRTEALKTDINLFLTIANRPFPSFLLPLFQNESKCKTFHMKMNSACSFIFMQISHFHKNGSALRLALKQRPKGTQKWPIVELPANVCPHIDKKISHWARVNFCSYRKIKPWRTVVFNGSTCSYIYTTALLLTTHFQY